MSEADFQSLLYLGALSLVAIGVAIKADYDDKRNNKHLTKRPGIFPGLFSAAQCPCESVLAARSSITFTEYRS